jgi:outer membrane receptor for ferrienterochelin and colicin
VFDEWFGGDGQAVTLEPDAISEIEVITGTFNAEYGKAMSGVVNQITKSGSNRFIASSNYASSNYLTKNSGIFIGIDDMDLNHNNDFNYQFSGPLIKDKVFFFINGRKTLNNNHLNGYDYFSVDDSSSYSSDNTDEWYSEHSGSYIDTETCMNNNGMEILNTDENLILNENECENFYGECYVTFSACLSVVNSELLFHPQHRINFDY